MARERGSRDSEAFPEPDMLPLMNIILMLILALITMAALLPLGLLSSEAQKLSRGGSAPSSTASQETPLNLIVFITEAGFNLSAYGDAKMGASDPANPGRNLPLVPKIAQADGSMEFDFLGLQAKLSEYKKADASKYNRDEQSITVTADPEIKFEVIIQVMDAARYDSAKEILFPKVSFAAGMVG